MVDAWQDKLKNPGDYAMVKSMNDIGYSLGLRTVAEHVESPMILDALREMLDEPWFRCGRNGQKKRR